jgi:tRNA(Ile)-lysidine synthase
MEDMTQGFHLQEQELYRQFRQSAGRLFSSSQQRYAVAVSGGGDSTAMLHLLHGLIGPARMVVLHFNHNLRPDAWEDEAWVRMMATDLQVPFFSETWQGPTGGNLQQAARHGRYAFFAEMCQWLRLAGVCVAHTRDDVAETLLMRLGRGSGVRGLAAMQEQTRVGGVHIVRPLLEFNRKDLRTFLQDEGLDWQDDPANQNPQFLRARMRQGIATLDGMGLSSRAVADAAGALRRADAALEEVTIRFLKDFADTLPNGGVVMGEALLDQPDEIAQRALEKVILRLNPAPLAPRVSKRLRVLAALREGQGTLTLGGVKFTRTPGGIECRTEG